MNKRIAGLLCLVLGIAACATTVETPEDHASRVAIAADLQNCFRQQAKLIDDHQSDASTIATAVANTCRGEQDVYLNALTKRLYTSEKIAFLSDFSVQMREDALDAVLAERHGSVGMAHPTKP